MSRVYLQILHQYHLISMWQNIDSILGTSKYAILHLKTHRRSQLMIGGTGNIPMQKNQDISTLDKHPDMKNLKIAGPVLLEGRWINSNHSPLEASDMARSTSSLPKHTCKVALSDLLVALHCIMKNYVWFHEVGNLSFAPTVAHLPNQCAFRKWSKGIPNPIVFTVRHNFRYSVWSRKLSCHIHVKVYF